MMPNAKRPRRGCSRAGVRGGGREGDRTLNLRLAKPTLSQLSYSPTPQLPKGGEGVKPVNLRQVATFGVRP